MPHKTKGKNANGAGAHLQTAEPRKMQEPMAESAQSPPRAVGHPLSRLRNEIDVLFDRFFSQWSAPLQAGWDPGRFWNVDLEDTDNEIRVRAEAPGFEPKDFNIHVSGNLLIIQAQHKHEAQEKEGEYRKSVWHYGRFQRSIPLPGAVDGSKAEANYRNGVLEVRLPRTEAAPRQRIEVKT